jgi:hypothetical protein
MLARLVALSVLAWLGCGTVSEGRGDGGTGGPDAGADAGPAARLVVAPDSVPFGDVEVATLSPAAALTVSNQGDAASQPLELSVTGGDATEFDIAGGDCSASPLAAGADCEVLVVFHPTSRLVKSAALAVAGSGGPTALLSGTGIGAELTWDPDSIDFGDVAVGALTAEVPSVLTNIGEIATGELGFSLVSGDPDFFISFGDCAATLEPGASCTQVFQGSPAAAGVRSAISDGHAEPGGQATISLTVTGVP